MTKCNWVPRLSAYVDHELPPAEAELVHQHLEGCQTCARAAAAYGDFRRRVVRIVDADGMVMAVRRRLGERQLWRPLWLVPAALVLVVAIGAGWYLEDSSRLQAQTEEVIESYIAVAGGF